MRGDKQKVDSPASVSGIWHLASGTSITRARPDRKPINKTMKNTNKKGFTLLELLIVIGILAILATVAILVINPAELLRRSRDSARISDLNTLKSAIGLYLTDAAVPDLDTNYGVCGLKISTSLPKTTIVCSDCLDATTSTQTLTNGTGWVPVNFGGMSTGSPLGALPLDPTNASSTGAANQLYYTYTCHNTYLTFLLTGRLESTYYVGTGATGYGPMSKDGGTATSVYEVGTAMTGIAPLATTTYGTWAI